MRIYHIIALSIITNISQCFNIDVNAPIIKSGTSNTSFGFSILGHTLSASNRGIIIGSPKSGINGEIFWCPSSQSTCQRVEVDVSKLARMNPKMNGALLGYSMASLRGDEPGKVTKGGCTPGSALSTPSLPDFLKSWGCVCQLI
ncbi:hypothetical protein AHF37_11982 [Paragonimus kellicotti]|nr:hypothetical protein AHF37_11982 [Paragonimus kellicotti]